MEKRNSSRLKEVIPTLKHAEGDQFLLIAGPCVVEGEEMAMEIAYRISALSDKYHIPYIFKASYRKANRSRFDSFTGIGDLKALEILRNIREKHSIPVVTDVHSPEEARSAADFVDVLQVPAFLSRQTDLLTACAGTGKTVSIKKGQFLSPGSMKFAVEKIVESGNRKVMVTERGTTFGYRDLVVHFRGIPEMQKFNVPVVLDVTHSLQQPNQESGVTGGSPELIGVMARAGIAAGVDGIFIETHPEPGKARSDGASMLRLNLLESLLEQLIQIRKALIR
jgi:2-dehydro-3-deoxyphosphooctonate aldolase (KDO 8-P synthase)